MSKTEKRKGRWSGKNHPWNSKGQFAKVKDQEILVHHIKDIKDDELGETERSKTNTEN